MKTWAKKVLSGAMHAAVWAACGALLVTGSAAAQSKVDAAKKEGKVVVYGSIESTIMRAIEKAFTQKYGVDVEFFRASSNKTLDRVLTEARANRTMSDVVLTNHGPMLLMKRDHLFAKYVSPEAANFPDDLKDPDGMLSPIYRRVIVGVLYNTNLVKPDDVPKTFEELLTPKWKGKWVMPDPSRHFTTGVWVHNFDKLYGKNWMSMVRRVAADKPILVESFLPSVQRIISGEALAGITYVKYVRVFGKDGAPLDYARLPVMLADGHNVAVQAKAPHPNAARLFEDFFISPEGMKILAAQGEFVTAKGLYPPIKDADKIKAKMMDEMTRTEYKKWAAEMRKLFLAR